MTLMPADDKVASVITPGIRGHHLLCIQGFQGYGYSRDFTRNMAEAARRINAPDVKVRVIAECDIICAFCPHMREDNCRKTPDSEERVKTKDLRIIKKLGLNEKEEHKAKDIFTLTCEKLRYRTDIQGICGDCGWKHVCLWFNSRL